MTLALLFRAAGAPAQEQTVELLSQIGGTCRAVQVVGNRAYIGEGPGLTILDTTNATAPVRMGRFPLPNVVEGLCITDGLAYVAAGSAGLKIIDVSNPTSPTLVGGYGTYVNRVKLAGNVLYASDGYVFRILDVSHPSSPTLCASYRLSPYNFDVSGTLAYVARGANGLTILDVSNASSPTVLCNYPGYVYGVSVSGNWAYVVGDSHLRVLDVTDPSSPTLRCSLAGRGRGVFAFNERVYVALNEYDDGPSSFRTFDVNDPSSPVLLGSYDGLHEPYELCQSGNLVYAADGLGGLQIINMWDPASPRYAGRLALSGGARAVAVSGNLAYVAGFGLQIVDVSNPSSPVPRGDCPTPHECYDVSVSGTLVCVSEGSDGILFIDVSNPSFPMVRSSYPGRLASVVHIAGGRAYFIGERQGLKILNVNDASSPTLLGSYPCRAFGLSVSGRFAYVIADLFTSNPQLYIIDVGDPYSPTVRSSYPKYGMRWLFDVSVSDNLAYLTYESNAGRGFQIIDVSVPSSPTLRGTHQGACGDISVSGNVAYVTQDSYSTSPDTGLEVVDVRDSTQPHRRGYCVAPGNLWTVTASGNLAYACSGNSGFSILRYTPMPPPAPSGLIASSTAWKRITLSWWDNASYEDGFKVERRMGTTGAWSQIGTAPLDMGRFTWQGTRLPSTYQDTAVTLDTTYYYRVCAYNTTGNSAYSNVTSATAMSGPPAAPSNLYLVGTGAPAVRPAYFPPYRYGLEWTDNSLNEEGFEIVWKAGVGGAWSRMTTATADATYQPFGVLAPSTLYYFRVRAFNPCGVSAYSNETSHTTRPGPPLAPSNLHAILTQTGSIRLTWQDNSNNEDEFIIFREANSAYQSERGRVAADVTTWTDTSVLGNTRYTYRVRASNSLGSSDSDSTSIATLPAAPTNLQATAVSDVQINLSWRDSSPCETGFEIRRLIEHSGTWVLVATLGPDATFYQDTPLPPSTTYYYVMRAFNDAGPSAYSDVARATTWPPPPAPPPPAPPTELTATALSYTAIRLAWRDNSDGEMGFKIECSPRWLGPCWDAWWETAAVGPDVTTWDDTSASTGSIYRYRVRAYDSSRVTAYSNEAAVATWDLIPLAPQDLRIVSVTSNSVTLSWTNFSHIALWVQVERRGGGYDWGVKTTLPAQVTSYCNTRLSPLTSYSYRVRAYDEWLRYSPYSEEISTDTLDVLPAPTNLVAQALAWNRVLLSWRDNSDNESGFKIERRRAAEAWREVSRVRPNVTSFLNTDCWANMDYRYRVRAWNWNGDSQYSNEVLIRTPVKPLAAEPRWTRYR